MLGYSCWPCSVRAGRNAGGGSPALVGLDLLLDVLPVGALSSLLGHSHKLDQLRPG